MRTPTAVPSGTLVGEDGRLMSLRVGYPGIAPVPTWMAVLVDSSSPSATGAALEARGVPVEWVLIEVDPQPKHLHAFLLDECPENARLLFVAADDPERPVRVVVACD